MVEREGLGGWTCLDVSSLGVDQVKSNRGGKWKGFDVCILRNFVYVAVTG
jgi:hypothetical protein